MNYFKIFKILLTSMLFYHPAPAMQRCEDTTLEEENGSRKRKIDKLYDKGKSSDKNTPPKKPYPANEITEQEKEKELKDDLNPFDASFGEHFFNLGSRCLDDLNTPENDDRMVSYVTLAACKGNSDVQSTLNKLYENWEMLPIELLSEIGSYLDNPADLYGFSMVCHNWGNAIITIRDLNLNLIKRDDSQRLLTPSKLISLKRLAIYCSDETYADFIKSFQQSKGLETFNLKANLVLTPKFIESINSLPNLTSLSLEDSIECVHANEVGSVNLREEGFSKLHIQSALTYLSLPRALIVYPEGMPLGPGFMECYNYPILLKILNLSKAHNLKTLKIYQDCWNKWNNSLIASFANIRELHVNFRPFFRRIMSSLKKMKVELQRQDFKVYGNGKEIDDWKSITDISCLRPYFDRKDLEITPEIFKLF